MAAKPVLPKYMLGVLHAWFVGFIGLLKTDGVLIPIGAVGMLWLKRLFGSVQEQKNTEADRPGQGNFSPAEPQGGQAEVAQEHWSERVARIEAARGGVPGNPTGCVPASIDSTQFSLSVKGDIHSLRIARLNQDEADARRYGIRHKFMHLSALSPSTRPTHASRHGQLFSAEEVRQWWAQDGNAEGCRCALTMILLDEKGNPRDGKLIDKAEKMLAAWNRKKD